MNERCSKGGTFTTDNIIHGIAARDRRRCLSILRDSDELLVELLEMEIAASQTEPSESAATESNASTRVRLVHRHLPKLADVGLLDWDKADGTISTTDHPALTNDAFWAMVETDGPDWDDVLSALSHVHRRLALSVLAESAETMPTTDLVKRVLALEDGVDPASLSDERVQENTAAFHHCHLPKLDDPGLVVYDGDEASYVGHTALDEQWFTTTLWDPTQSYRVSDPAN